MSDISKQVSDLIMAGPTRRIVDSPLAIRQEAENMFRALMAPLNQPGACLTPNGAHLLLNSNFITRLLTPVDQRALLNLRTRAHVRLSEITTMPPGDITQKLIKEIGGSFLSF